VRNKKRFALGFPLACLFLPRCLDPGTSEAVPPSHRIMPFPGCSRLEEVLTFTLLNATTH